MSFNFYLFEDGSAAMMMIDKAEERYFLSPSGAVVVIEKNQSQLRFLTCTLPQIFHKNINELVEFRNRHVFDNLYVTKFLGNQIDLLMERSSILKQVTWDLNVKPRANTTISSIDRYVEISIDPHLQTFQVTFPYLVYDPDRNAGVYDYTLITQRHPTANPPKYWIYPLILLLKSDSKIGNESLDPNLKTELLDNLHILARSLKISRYSQPSANEEMPESVEDLDVIIGQSHMTTKIPYPSLDIYMPSHPLNISFKPPSIISLVHLDPVKVVETSLGTFHILKPLSIFITLPDDAILSASDLEFLRIYKPPEWNEEVYVIDGLTTLTNHATGVRYDIPEILSFALGLFQSAHGHELKKEKVVEVPKKIQSFKIKKSVNVERLGDFTVYDDSRVKGHFVDGVVVEIDGDICRVLGNDGEWIFVRRNNPVGFEKHVNALEQFVYWVENGSRARIDERAKDMTNLTQKIRERKGEIERTLGKIGKLLNNVN